MSYGKNMMLVTTYWGQDKTFKMMPVTQDAPYMEVIYDTNTDLLVAITTNMKENLQKVPRIDDDGEIIKTKKPKANGKPYREKQVLMKIPQEFYFAEREEAIEFIEKFAVNAETFDYKKFFTDLEAELEKKAIYTPEAAPLVDENGKPLAPKKGKKVIQMAGENAPVELKK